MVADPAMAARMRRQRRLMRIVNVPMRALLSIPLPTPINARLMLLRIRGRRSGRVYRQPVSYVRDGATLLTPGGGRWTRNLVAGEAVPANPRGREQALFPELVSDPDAIVPLLERLIRGNPRASSFMPFVDGEGRIDQRALGLALDHGFCVVRWHLEPAT